MFYNSANLVRQRLKSYPRVSEISQSVLPPVLDSIYLPFTLWNNRNLLSFGTPLDQPINNVFSCMKVQVHNSAWNVIEESCLNLPKSPLHFSSPCKIFPVLPYTFLSWLDWFCYCFFLPIMWSFFLSCLNYYICTMLR